MSFQHRIQRVMSGQAKGLGPTVLRGLFSVAEPFYTFAVNRRNKRFDRDPSRVRRLPRPVVSVGNLTTGGTGKTPVIRFLAEALRARGRRVAILSRGYKARPGTLGDEQRMLQLLLGPGVEIEADPDRYAAGMRVLERSPTVELFLLDDGFQHRRLHRDLDIVLLHADEPFGYGHLLPRGLLREPVSSLSRANAIIVTNANAGTASGLAFDLSCQRPEDECPIFIERHEPTGFRHSTGGGAETVGTLPLSALTGRRAFVFSGLGSPGGFESAVRKLAGDFVGARRFPDHHDYTVDDLSDVQAEASRLRADVLVTTEKDWVKLADLQPFEKSEPPIWRLDVEATFDADGARRLVECVECVESTFDASSNLKSPPIDAD